jgi:putative endonuclease
VKWLTLRSATRLRRANPTGKRNYEMKFIVYILKSLKDGKRYIGCTADFERRLHEHNSGKVKSTRNRRPLLLIHSESFETKVDAKNREKFFKSGQGREYLTLHNIG